ncbi:acyltransferase family protein [Mucilaginibacter myungsuensis]|uniref:Acyltransferase n=1 Tax=Mucilaginibacter myungsuensis TaxID=649104 RepID=A0A929KVH4_9SPHI|nr:acyltransferase [Mucilaginibacter myungsuensis]MBE9662351.1 acyltransferase [Mucilaginibacter myungsuensis]MDN3599212.1 acyltransferase [Mucilaginibacter myungsuensis]
MQQNLGNSAPAKRNYTFIDNIRCIAMMSIVADHAFSLGDNLFKGYDANFWVYGFNIQIAKFGTITFFLMAGFLLGDKFAEYTPGQYLGRRFKSTFKPWIIWSLVFLVAVMIREAVLALRIYHDPFDFWAQLLHTLKIVYLDSNYWFIINFLICIGMLLIFKKVLYKWQLGAGLMLCTLFYSVNIYNEWIFPVHTTALFGFVFFLWLGAQLHKNWDFVERRILSAPIWVFVTLFLIALCLALAEIRLLTSHGSVDPFNTLRISNIIYSLIAFGLLVKIKNLDLVSYFKPRETTYGIYLVHYIIIYNVLGEILIHFNVPAVTQMSAAGLFVYQYSRFLIVYLLTLGIVKGINRTSFKWVIGNNVTAK